MIIVVLTGKKVLAGKACHPQAGGSVTSGAARGRRRISQQVASRVAVMYLGRIVEIGDTEVVWGDPRHPYTEALVAAIPRADGAGVLPADLPGGVPDPASPPSGCRFQPRCPIAVDSCRELDQRLKPVAGREIACHLRS